MIPLTGEMMIGAAAVLSAGIAIFGAVFAVYRWYLRQNRQDDEIKSLKEEQTLLTYGVLACLKGLSEQGCNGPVSEAIGKIEQHLNQRAHE
ncbi:MAG: branched-chain amino acid ABC transporter permease [Ruminiclostridium sp.]|nr:branched-chain amino acid ABC transporter permease [Ruminiclostridium sp.]